MAKRVDPLKAKKAKQKKVAIGLCVLLAAVVAFQGPKMLKMMKGPQAAAVAEPATPVATPTPTAAVPGATVAPLLDQGSVRAASHRGGSERQSGPGQRLRSAGDRQSDRLRRPCGHVRSARLEPTGSGPQRSPGEHHSVG